MFKSLNVNRIHAIFHINFFSVLRNNVKFECLNKNDGYSCSIRKIVKNENFIEKMNSTKIKPNVFALLKAARRLYYYSKLELLSCVLEIDRSR